jgi:hypothetical protein
LEHAPAIDTYEAKLKVEQSWRPAISGV